MTKTKSNFRGKVKRDAVKQVSTKGSYYLNLPNGVKLYNAEADTRRIKLDFLPYKVSDPNHPNKDEKNEIALPGSLWWRRPILVHKNVGADNEKVICLKSVGKRCPVCEFQKKRFNEGAPKEETKEYYPQRRSLFVVVPIDQDIDEEPMIWDMSDRMFLDVLVDELEEDDSNEIFPDLEEGKTMEISLKWNTIGERGRPFPEARSIRFLDREPYDDKILKEVPDLDKILNILSYEDISNKFLELDTETGEELTDVEEEPKPRKRFHKEERNNESEEESKRSFRRERKTEKEAEVDEAPEPQRHRRNIKEEESEEKPKRTRGERVTEKDKCPYGHVFGVDTDKYNDCDKCNLWDECIDAKEGK